MTTLPLPPSAAALIGLVVLALLIYLALLLIGRDRPAPVWEGLPPVGSLSRSSGRSSGSPCSS